MTADHGENFGSKSDEKLLQHTSSLSEGVLHVPFDIIAVNTDLDEQNVSTLSSHAEIPRIISALENQSKIPDISREEVLAEIIGASTEPNEYKDYFDRSQRAVYLWNQKQKIVRDENGDESVFEIDITKPSQQKEINSSENFEKFFSKRFGEWIRTETTRRPPKDDDKISKETEERLENLGYM